MTGRIPQQFIDELLNRIDIVEVIDSRVPLKKAGREFKACCPFHGEKTPSFTVSPVKQFYHCFGCGEHGSAISFLMDYEHMDFVEAVEELARQVGMDVPRDGTSEPRQPSTAPDQYELLEQAASYYQQQLRTHPESNRAVDYLKQRGLTGEIAALFGIGYAPPGWENLAATLGRDKQSRAALLENGLCIERPDGSLYDRFRDRIQFPIHDRRGRTIGFGGRVLGDETPKYLNSPDSPVFHKGQELYGLYEARKAARQLTRVLVVEGYMDVVALAQFGINYAVATLGTATTHEHLERIYRVMPGIVFCFDGDRAGQAAAWRALENTLPLLRDGREARFLFLPEGEDPDSMVRDIGREAFEERITGAVPLSDFFFEHLSSQVDTVSIDGRSRLVELARPLLSRLPDGIFHQLMLERLAELVHTSSAGLAQRLQPHPEPPPNRKTPAGTASGNKSPVRQAIEILLHQPSLVQSFDLQGLRELEPDALAGVSILVELLELLKQQPNLNTAAILEHWRERDEARYLYKLAQWTPLLDDLDLAAEFGGHLYRIKRQLIDNKIKSLLETQSRRSLSEQEKQELQDLLRTGNEPASLDPDRTA